MRLFKAFGYELTFHPSKHTILHPEYKTLTDFAFEIEGVRYYQFRSLLDMPTKRYKKVMEFIREAELSLTSKDICELLDISIKSIEEGKVSRSIIIQNDIVNLASQFIETDTYYRLFSCCFFTEGEDLTDYDFDYGDVKIEAFKKEYIPDFFLKKPMKKYLPQVDILKEDIEVYSKLTSVNKSRLLKIRDDYTKSQ